MGLNNGGCQEELDEFLQPLNVLPALKKIEITGWKVSKMSTKHSN